MRLRAPAPIDAGHDPTGFDCGNAAMDRWLRGQAPGRGDAQAGVFVTADAEGRVLGAYAVAAGSVRRANLPAGDRRNAPVPVLKLGRIAVDRSLQGQGIGTALLVDAIERTRAVGLHVPLAALVTDVPDPAAAGWFARLGFRPVPGRAGALVLPMVAIAALLAGAGS